MTKRLSVAGLKRLIAEEVRRAVLLEAGEFYHSSPDDRGEFKGGRVHGKVEDGYETVEIVFSGGQKVVMNAADVAEFIGALEAGVAEAQGVTKDGESTELSKFPPPGPGEYWGEIR